MLRFFASVSRSRSGERFLSANCNSNKAGGNAGEAIFRKLVFPAQNIRFVICGHIAAPDEREAGAVFSVDRNSSGKSVVRMAFHTQAIGGGFHGNGGDGWRRRPEFMHDRKTLRATTFFSPLFAISPSARHPAWRRDAVNEFTFSPEQLPRRRLRRIPIGKS